MSSSLRPQRLLFAFASLAILAACSSQPMQQSEAAPAAPAPAMMTQTSAGNMMTTPTGMTLYTFDKDAAGRSNCDGQCIQYWHPLLATQGATATANMTLINRNDGRMQWATANGMPLYTYVNDKVPGDAKGNNFHNEWHVAM